MKKEKMLWLESMRGLACLLVLGAHILSFHPNYGIYANGCGKIGVWFFFAVSAFLLVYHADEKIINLKSFSSYYWNRLLRLYPIYFIALLIAFLTGMLPSGIDVVKHLLLIEGTAHFWYMAVIIKFYLIAPFFVWLYNRKNKIVFIGTIVVIGIATGLVFPFTQYEENSIALYWYLPLLMLGMLLAIIYKRCLGLKENWIWDIMVILASIIILFMTPWVKWIIWEIPASSFLQNKYLPIGILWCIIIFSIPHSKVIKELLEKCSFLQGIGRISYPVYLIHYVILWRLDAWQINWISCAIGTVCGSLLIAYLINIWLLKIKRFKS